MAAAIAAKLPCGEYAFTDAELFELAMNGEDGPDAEYLLEVPA